jgi:hypothetical protein
MNHIDTWIHLVQFRRYIQPIWMAYDNFVFIFEHKSNWEGLRP